MVGDGARENAIAEGLMRSERSYRVYAFSSYRNPGIDEIVRSTGGSYHIGDVNSPEEVKQVVGQVSPDLVVIGPEEPLFRGVSDAVRELGVPVLGASSKCSMVERSKVWMRELMWKYSIPGRLRFRGFRSVEEAASFISEYGASVAVKPAEQVGGKGVKVAADLQAYLTQEKRSALSKGVKEVASLIKEGYKVIIEERVFGPEYTLHVITDGKSHLALPLAQDYKHAYANGIGPETGGMGSISGPGMLLPFINEEEFMGTFEIVKATTDAIKRETGEEYSGILAGQMMLTTLWGPTVIEYYSRLGDPEASAILPRIDGDLGELFEYAATGRLSRVSLAVNEERSVVWALAPRGYPLNRAMASGHRVSMDLSKMREIGCRVYFGSISLEGMSLVTRGSRALEIEAEGDDAVEKLERCVSLVSSEVKLIYRPEIGRNLEEQVRLSESVRYAYKLRERNNTLGVSVNWSPKSGEF